MKCEKTFVKRLLAMVLCVLLTLSCSPVPALAVQTPEYGTVEAPEAAAITGNNTEEVQADYTILQWKDSAVHPELAQSGWWIEMAVYAPENMMAETDFETAEASVTYQRLQGDEWSEAINFWQAQESDPLSEEERYVSFAELVSAEMLENTADGELVTISWRFDWDMDGVYEQLVQAVIDPAEVTLYDGAVQVYPALGQVETYTGGAIEGNCTSRVQVNVLSISQKWSEADAQIGKTEKGWGVGLRVNAPKGAANAPAVRMDENEAETIPLIMDQGGAGYLNLWIMLAVDMTEDIDREFDLDWDADGNYDQTVSVFVDVSEMNLTLMDQPSFAFETAVPEDQYILDGSYSNVAVGGLEEQAVSYALVTENQELVAENDVASIDTQTGTLTFKTVGEVTVRATKSGTEGYADAVAEYHLNIIKNQPDMAFATTGVVELTYEDGLTFQNTASVDQVADSDITYYLDLDGVLVTETEMAEIDEQSGEVTILKAGEVEVWALGTGNEYYADAKCSYTLLIEKAEQKINYVDAPVQVVYSPEVMDPLTVEGGVTGSVVFEVLDGKDLEGNPAEVAQVNQDGSITLLRAGCFTVGAVMTGDDCYADSEQITTVIYVEKAEQDALAFADSAEQFRVTYDETNNTFVNEVVGSLSTEPVEYALVQGDNFAVVDKATGVVTFDAAGTIVVQAKSPADDRYYEKAVSYTLIVERAEQVPVFRDGAEVSKKYGITEYENPLTYKGDGEMTYTLSGDEIGVEIDSQTGRLTFHDGGCRVGELTVTATKKEDSRYLPFIAEYKLTVSYLSVPAEAYILSGETKNDSGWYTGDVTITAPEGYLISYSNLLQGNTWSKSVLHPHEGINTPVIYLKEASGDAITDAIEVPDVKVDKTAPQIMSVRCDETYWSEIQEQIFFSKNPVVVAVTTATDVSASGENVVASQIEKYMYSLDGGLSFTELAANTSGGSVSFEIDPQYRDTVAIYAVDTAGNESLCVSQDLIVDNIAPKVAITYPGTPVATIEADDGETVTRQDMTALGEKTRFVYTDQIGLQIRVEESNFFEDDISIRVLHRSGSEIGEGWTETAFQETAWTQDGIGVYIKELVLGADVSENSEANGDYVVEITYSDSSTNAMEWTSGEYNKSGTEVYTSNILSIDNLAPTATMSYEDLVAPLPNAYKEDRTATYRITDRNFRPNEVEFVVKPKNINGKAVGFDHSELTAWTDWTRVGGSTWEAKVTYDQSAVYEISLNYQDIAGNSLKEMLTDSFTVDKTAPEELNIVYSDNYASTSKLGNILYRFFNGGENKPATVTLFATDLTTGVDYFEVDVTPDNPAEATNIQLPSELKLIGLNSNEPKVAGLAGDLKNFRFETYDEETGEGRTAKVSFDVPYEFRGSFDFRAYDMLGNTAEYGDDDVVVVDTIAPNVTISYPGSPAATIESDEGSTVTRQDMTVLNEKTRFIYTDSVELQLRVEEINFFKDDISIRVLHRPGNTVNETWKETAFQETEWTQEETGVYTKDVVLGADVRDNPEANGDYMIEVIYSDSSANEMNWESGKYDTTGTNKYEKAGAEVYTSNILSIDNILPTVAVTYDNMETKNEDCFKKPREATYRITDRNFRPNEVVFEVTKVENINGTPVEFTYSRLTAWSDWTRVGGGNTWEAKVCYDQDAVYEMSLNYTDIAGHSLKEVFIDGFTVDQTAPVGLEIIYSENHANKMDIGNMIYRFFNAGENKPTTVTLLASDLTSGVDYFDVQVSLDDPREATNIQLPVNLRLEGLNTDEPKVSGSAGDLKNFVFKKYDSKGADGTPVPGKTVEVSFEVPWEFRGSFDFSACDRAGNQSNYGDNSVVVVDSIAPTRTVTYNPTQIISESRLTEMNSFSEGDKSILFHNDDAVVEFEVTEANFYPEDIKLFVNGTAYEFDHEWRKQSGVTWRNTLTFTREDDYEFVMEYVDRSNNTMIVYESPVLVIDRTAPVIRVGYGYNHVENTLKDWEGERRDYFSREQTVIVEVVERNFRADDVVVKVSAVDSDGQNVMRLNSDGYVAYYAEEGTDRDNWSSYNVGTWRRRDDTFELTLYFREDANYTFDIECKDMALNQSKKIDPLYFTVDQTKPVDLEIEYSTSVLEEVLESLTFGFYNAMMTVDISARDETAGIHQFQYSYLNSPGVSSVNAELIDQIISEAEIDVRGSRAKASFTIPKYVLKDDNQFNGTVKFAAMDRSNNSEEMQDTKRIVVDNISPVAQVSYNAPVSQRDDISYYNRNIEATVEINEANFYATDVMVAVYRDGENYPVHVEWKDLDVDNHTGTFTLTEEGNYEVAISYVDKSENVMTDYRSNTLIIDKVRPSITVSNIRNNSANKDELYSFDIEVYDVNLNEATITPSLTAVVSAGEGKYETVPVDLGTMRVLETGKRYVYSVPNLEKDGVYTLTCSAEDLAGNANNEIMLEDENLYQEVQFSINRNGSTFRYGTPYTEEVVRQYFIYDLKEPLVIEEINVDSIEDYSVLLNGQDLLPDEDFETEQTDDPDEWHMRRYTLDSELFDEEGEYQVVVTSMDKAETRTYSDLKGLGMSFVVDQTAPVLTISGLEKGGRYRTQEQTVTVMPTDEGGKLYSLKAVVTMPNGEAIVNEQDEDISVRFDMEGEELEAYLIENGGKVTFTVPEGLQRYVQIICRDCAMNAEGNSNEYNEVFKNVTVSDNDVVIFYANKPLFYSVVSACLAIAAATIVLINKKKAKKAAAQ